MTLLSSPVTQHVYIKRSRMTLNICFSRRYYSFNIPEIDLRANANMF